MQNEPASSRTLLNVSSTPGNDHAKRKPQNAHTIADASNPRFYIPNEIRGQSETLPPGIYPGGIKQTYDHSSSDIPKVFPVNSSNNLDSEMRDIQPGMNTAGDIEMTMANNPEVPLEFDHAL